MEQIQEIKMENKFKNKIFAGILALAIIIPVVLALTGVIQVDSFYDSSTNAGLTNVESLLFNCADSSCTNIGSQVHDLNSNTESPENQITFEYPYNPSSTSNNRDYYAHYVFAQCYIPKEYVESIWGYGVTLNYDYNFDKATSCHSPIDSFSVTNSNYANEPVVVSLIAQLEADAHSAFTNLLLAFVPSGFEDYYSAETTITLEILDENENVVYTESKTYEILQDTVQNVEFTWTPTSEGDYTAKVKTDVIDCQCESSFEQQSEKQFVVWEERPQNQCYTIINDLEATPEFATQGDTINVNFNKISNYADNNYDKTAITTNATYEITDNNGNVVYSDNVLLSANANPVDSKNIEFSWTPDFGGNYNIKVTGIGEDALCDGKTNPADIAILGFFVKATNQYNVEFVVTDSNSGNPLESASVEFGTQTGETNSAGKVSFNSNTGTFDWEVSLNDYDTKTGSATVSDDVTINVALVAIENDDEDDGSSSSKGKTSNIGFILTGQPSTTGDVLGYKPSEDLKIIDKGINWNSVLVWSLLLELLLILVIVFIIARRSI